MINVPASGINREIKNLILAKWMRSFRRGNDFIKLIDSDSYYAAYTHYVLHVLARPGAELRMAVLADDRDVVLGFAIIEKSTLHYVFTNKDFRRNGIATSLIGNPKKIEWITHLTKSGLNLWPSLLSRAKLNPFI